ncbi:unnamed protein product, partial [Ilex paraguariensis]
MNVFYARNIMRHWNTYFSTDSPKSSSPPCGFLKLNFDGGPIFHWKEATGIGVVARDCNGKFLAGFNRLVQGITCSEQIEWWPAYA